MLFAACSEFEADYSNLSDKSIRFRVTSGTESRSCASVGAQAMQHPLVAKTTDEGILYLHPIVQSTERMEQLRKEASRAAITTENLESISITASRHAAGALGITPADFIYNKTATKNVAGYWETATQYLWPANSDKLSFFAYAPVGGSGITLSAASRKGAPAIDFEVQSSAANNVDLIAAAAFDCTWQAQARNGVPLTFSHTLTTVKFALASSLTGTLKRVTIKGLYTRGQYVFPSAANTAGAWDFSGEEVSTYTIDYTGVVPSELSLFMIPQNFGESASIEAVYNNGSKDITLSVSLNGQQWTAGSSFTYLLSDSEVYSMKLGNIFFPPLYNGLPKKAYANGDKAGLYVVDAQGHIIADNVMLRYNGSSWVNNGAMPYSADYDYYAYYPYSNTGLANIANTPSGAKNMSRSTVFDLMSSAEAFFAPGIEAWTPAEDQSTAASFTASDLHIAKGYLSTTDVTGIDFMMGHAMGLAQISLGTKNIGEQQRYLSIDSNYKWYDIDIAVTATSAFSGSNIPYKYNNTNYFVWLKPGSSTTFSSSSTEADAWKESLTYTNIAANKCTSKTAYSKRESSSASATSYTLAVGDILYSDGSLSKPNSLLSGKTPVAIVFMATTNASSPVTTTKDRTANSSWKHGYAMALKNVSGGYKWANSNSDVSGIPNISDETWQTRSSDMDGYTNTTYLNNSNYPAGYAAATTYASQATAPTASSGWFLPSSGQWFWILRNLGGMSATPDNALGWSNMSSTAASNLNTKLGKAGSGNYDSFSNDGSSYWSSSESSSANAYLVFFAKSGGMNFAYDSGKSFVIRVRAVLAF